LSIQNKRHSIRLPQFDYTQPGAYFVTIVTYERQSLFGEIRDQAILLNNLGLLVQHEWLRLPARFKEIELDEYIIMPNHIHGIIVIGDDRMGIGEKSNSINDRTGTGVKSSLLNNSKNPRAPTGEQFGNPIPGSIPTIIRSFKASVTYRVKIMRGNFEMPVWQRNYYEHVIRDEPEWHRTRLYIQENPAQWSRDNENPIRKT
jgi:putative transposase